MEKQTREHENGSITIELSKEYYLREAVFAAAEKYTPECSIGIQPGEPNSIVVELYNSKNNRRLKSIADELSSEILDQQVRLDLEKRNGHIRELIIRHAFSPLDNLEEEVSGNE